MQLFSLHKKYLSLALVLLFIASTALATEEFFEPIKVVTGGTQKFAVDTNGNTAVAGTLAVTGATTLNSSTAHGVLIGEATSPIFSTAAGSAGQILTSGGPSADPGWTAGSSLNLGATQYGVQVGGSSGAIASLSVGALNTTLMGGGDVANPSWTGSPSFSGSVGVANTLTVTGNTLISNGRLEVTTNNGTQKFSVDTSGNMSGSRYI